MTKPDIPIEELLAELGLTGATAAEGRRILEAEGITNPRKQRIATDKRERARAALDARIQRLCHDCLARAAHDGRAVVQVARAFCTSCGGSANSRAVGEMTDAALAAGVRRVLVVGGSPSLRRELTELVPSELELRLVDGTRVPDRRTADADVAWADLIVVLASSELAHKVSGLYTKSAEARPKLITSGRRGVAALAEEVARSDVVRRRSH